MVCTTKVKDETFRNWKRYEDKAKYLLPLKSMGDLFLKKDLHG